MLMLVTKKSSNTQCGDVCYLYNRVSLTVRSKGKSLLEQGNAEFLLICSVAWEQFREDELG